MNAGCRGKVAIIAVGDELGFEFPQEIIERYQLRASDTIDLTWDDSGLRLTFAPTSLQSGPPQDDASQ